MTNTQPKKSDLPVRALSAVVMIAVAGTALWLGGWVWAAFVAAVALGVLWEWRGLVRRISAGPLLRAVWMVGGVIYVGFAAFLLAVLGNDSVTGSTDGMAARGLLAAILLVVIATDVGAYFVGRAIGGPRIAPAISPSKTWAGLIGGMVLAGCVPVAFAGFGLTRASLAAAFASGALLAVGAQAGDFFESWMKRRAGVKDSGRLIPGHGGLFDRVDGLLAVANIVAIVAVVAISNSTDL